MGCCCRKSRELKELEAELERLLSQKRVLDSKPTESSESLSTLMPDISKFIDHDQYLSLKVIENLFSLLSGDIQAYQSLAQKIQGLSSLSQPEKLANYGDIRIEESTIQEKMLSLFKDQYKDLLEFRNTKNADIEERIEKVENLFGNSEEMLEDREKIRNKFKSVQVQGKLDMQGVVKSLKDLSELEKLLNCVESVLPALVKDDFFILRLKEAQKELPRLIKSSVCTLNSMKSVFSEVHNSDNIDELDNKELDEHTFTTLLTSLTSQLKSLQDLETQKTQLMQSSQIADQIENIEKSLTKYLLNSEQLKSLTQSRLNRVSRSSIELNQLQQSLFLKLGTKKKSIPETIKILEKKFSDFLISLEKQDQLLLEMTEKFNTIDKTVDEIELKFQEFFSAEVKDLYKDISYSDARKKNEIDEINEKLIEYNEGTHKDLAQRLEHLHGKVMLTERIDKIKQANREFHAKELNKVKSEMQEKVNELSNKVDLLENEKLMIGNSLDANKAQLVMTRDMVENLMKSANDKEFVVTELKNNIASLQEQLDQANQDKYKLEDEVNDIRKELRDCKKQLRSKEHELSELQEQLSNLTSS